MVPKNVLQTCFSAPAAGSLMARVEGLLQPSVTAHVGQMRGLVTPGQATSNTNRQSRSLDTLATMDDGQIASMAAARPFHEMPQPKK